MQKLKGGFYTKNRIVSTIKWMMSDELASTFLYFALFGLFIYFVMTEASIEKSLPTLILFATIYISNSIQKITSEVSEMRRILPKAYMETQVSTQSTTRKYFARLVQFLMASDILKEMYADGLLYDPNFIAKNGALTINLPDGMALIVKDMGYPIDAPGVYINLRDPADNEYCVVRVEFDNSKENLKIIAYQHGKDEAVINIPYLPKETNL